jgi:D-glycero-alpha-D-manno-heptose 1-phosphate guanylyltransferase
MTEMVLLCGGRGTRLQGLTQTVPKPLLPIGGCPFLLRLMLQYQREGVEQFILSVQYLAEEFEKFVMEYDSQLPPVRVVMEPGPLGTGGALKLASEHVSGETFFAANGDSYVSHSMDLLRNARPEGEGLLFMTAVPGDRVIGGTRQKGTLESDSQSGLLRGFRTLSDSSHEKAWVNAGLYRLEKKAMARWPSGKFDVERDVFPNTQDYPVKVVPTDGFLMDIGLPECYSFFDRNLGKLESGFEGLEKLIRP